MGRNPQNYNQSKMINYEDLRLNGNRNLNDFYPEEVEDYERETYLEEKYYDNENHF